MAKVEVTLIRSLNRRTKKTQATVRGLGLRGINSSKVLTLTPEVQGMIDKVGYLIKVKEV